MKNKKQIKNSNYIVLLSTISILLISGSIFYFNKLKINSNENYILGISDTLKGIEINFNDDKGKIFEIVIQLGAILAVCFEFRKRLWNDIDAEAVGSEVDEHDVGAKGFELG